MPARLAPLLEAPGDAQMRVDEGLLDLAAETRAPAVRAGVWSRPAVSLGRRMKARDAYSPRRLARLGLDAVRRPTGGLAILHEPSSFTLHAAAPPGHWLHDQPVVEAAWRLAALIAASLRSAGLDARPPPRPWGRLRLTPYPTSLCLAYTSPGDVLAGDYRKAGSLALRRTSRGTLAQAVVLVGDPDYHLWARVDGYPSPSHLRLAFRGLEPGAGPGRVDEAAREAARSLAGLL